MTAAAAAANQDNKAAQTDTDKRIEELYKKGTRMTVQEKLELVDLLTKQANEEKEAQKEQKMKDIVAFIKDAGYTLEEVVDHFKAPATAIFGPWTDSNGHEHFRYAGDKGKAGKWVDELKRTVSKADALRLAHGDKGTAFVENIYNPKTK